MRVQDLHPFLPQQACEFKDRKHARGRINSSPQVNIHNPDRSSTETLEQRTAHPQAAQCDLIMYRIETPSQFHRLCFSAAEHERIEQKEDPSARTAFFIAVLSRSIPRPLDRDGNL